MIIGKKYFLFVLAVCGVLLISFFLFSKSEKKYQKQITAPPTQAVAGRVFVSIDYGNGEIKSFETDVKTKNAYDLLIAVTKENNIELVSQTYSFGVFVKSIGGFESSKDKAWIYFVNGKSGNVAADKYEVKSGDVVEWKYMTPSE